MGGRRRKDVCYFFRDEVSRGMRAIVMRLAKFLVLYNDARGQKLHRKGNE